MSYARWGEPFIENRRSEVYVVCCSYFSCMDCKRIRACGGPFPGDESNTFACDTILEMIAHLMGHIALGDAVPPGTFADLWFDALTWTDEEVLG